MIGSDKMGQDEGFVFLSPVVSVHRCSDVCMVEQWGPSSRLYLVCPWMVIVALQRIGG